MFGFKFLGNTRIPHKKSTADSLSVRMAPPAEVLLPMAQHIGAPATPIVKVGDLVKVGQKVAEASGYVSSPVYASVSGKVTKLDSYLRPDGRTVPAIRIESDGEMTPCETVCPPSVESLEELLSAVKESGLVGLGGAGFPTSVKLDALKKGLIDTVVVNGAECEPYITSDTRTMLEDTDDVVEGVSVLNRFLPRAKIIIGIEDNKSACIKLLRERLAERESVSVVALPSLYPQGGEKVLVYNTTRRVIPEGKLPADVGVLVINVTSLAFIAQYLRTGMPLVEKRVTVDGGAVRNPMNIIAPIGTSIRAIAEACGGFTEELGKVLFGGPMMGVPACNLDEPIAKTTNALTALTEAEADVPDATACIHCGRCVSACPMYLNPTAFSRALNLGLTEDRVERLEAYKINLCMECGCCSFVCPAKRPLVQNNRLGKAEVRSYRSHQAGLKNAEGNPPSPAKDAAQAVTPVDEKVKETPDKQKAEAVGNLHENKANEKGEQV